VGLAPADPLHATNVAASASDMSALTRM
jgi:hypothetical protein